MHLEICQAAQTSTYHAAPRTALCLTGRNMIQAFHWALQFSETFKNLHPGCHLDTQN